MNPRTSYRELVSGSGLIVALTLTLVVAAVLAGLGLFQQLSGARTTVLAEQRPVIVASQAAPEAAEHAAHDDADDASADPHADPADVPAAAVVGANEVAPGMPGPPDSATPVHPGSTAGNEEWAPAVGPAPGPAAPDAVARAPSPVASPEVAAAVAPSPEAVHARTRPAAGPRGAPRQAADVPIVMYHHVGPLPPNPDIYRRDLTVSPELFERTLQQLAERQVETVTMAELMEHFAGGPELPKRSAILTFDDGYDDNYDHAFRLLRQYGMVGTFFVTTDFVERPGYLSWAQIAEMADAGMEIAAHSSNHADFTKIGPNELKRQLVEPKALLEEHIGQKVRFMAYPAGKYSPAVMAATRAAGYEAAVTVIHGMRHAASGVFELRRVRARGADSAAEILARMTPASWR